MHINFAIALFRSRDSLPLYGGPIFRITLVEEQRECLNKEDSVHSATAERVFSLLQISFSDHQGLALHRIILKQLYNVS